MEMKVRPVKADLQDGVKIGQGAIGSYEKAPPEHRVNPANPNVDIVSFGLRIVFHYAAQPIRWTTPRLFLAPGLKCSPFSPFTLCAVSRRTNVLYFPFRGAPLEGNIIQKRLYMFGRTYVRGRWFAQTRITVKAEEASDRAVSHAMAVMTASSFAIATRSKRPRKEAT